MGHGRYEETRIAVAFGDIAGFTVAYERATSPLNELAPFFDRFDALLTKMARQTGFNFKDTGDGFMCTLDLPNGHNCGRVLKMLAALWELTTEINREINGMKDDARFRFFRTRIAAGYVLRKVNRHGEVVYRGKPINLAHNLLAFSKETPVIFHGSFGALVSERQLKAAGYVAESIRWPKRAPETISAADMRRLFSIKRIKK